MKQTLLKKIKFPLEESIKMIEKTFIFANQLLLLYIRKDIKYSETYFTQNDK